MANELAGRVALITGAAHGQGRASALALAREGVHLAALDVARTLTYPGYELGSPQALDTLAEECRRLGVECLTFAVDVRDDKAVSAAVRRDGGAPGPHRHPFQQRRHLRLRPGPRADRGGVGRDARHQSQRGMDRGPPRHSAHDRASGGRHSQQFVDRRTARHGAVEPLRRLEVGTGRPDEIVGDRVGSLQHPRRVAASDGRQHADERRPGRPGGRDAATDRRALGRQPAAGAVDRAGRRGRRRHLPRFGPAHASSPARNSSSTPAY